MQFGIDEISDALVVDHEFLNDVEIPGQKIRVKTLKDARRALLEDSFNAIIFLSLLEESNEIEAFVEGVRSHPKLKSLPVYCEHGLTLALPKELGLIPFQEGIFDEVYSTSEDIDEIFSEDEALSSKMKVDPEIFLNQLTDASAKALVVFELNMQESKSKDELLEEYLLLLKSEMS